MTYNVFGGTLNLARSINVTNWRHARLPRNKSVTSWRLPRNICYEEVTRNWSQWNLALSQRLMTVTVGGVNIADGVHHGFHSFPRLHSGLEYLVGRQQEAVSTAISQLHRVDVWNVGDSSRPVA